jgi:hypothetical protein
MESSGRIGVFGFSQDGGLSRLIICPDDVTPIAVARLAGAVVVAFAVTAVDDVIPKAASRRPPRIAIILRLFTSIYPFIAGHGAVAGQRLSALPGYLSGGIPAAETQRGQRPPRAVRQGRQRCRVLQVGPLVNPTCDRKLRSSRREVGDAVMLVETCQRSPIVGLWAIPGNYGIYIRSSRIVVFAG